MTEREPRRYTMKRRAERQAQTRARIIDATIAAHQAGDPDGITISAIARRAGVGRLTVYRHFPDELSLYTACTSVYHARHPMPDMAGLADIADPQARLGAALAGLYDYYADNEAMLASGAAAASTHPAMLEALRPWFAALDDLKGLLAAGWPVDVGPGSLVAGALGHALAFQTWMSLRAEQGLTNEQAATLMGSLVAAAVAASPPRRVRA